MNATLESVLSFEGNDTNGTLMDRYDPGIFKMNATLESVLSFEGNDTNGTLMDRYDPTPSVAFLSTLFPLMVCGNVVVLTLILKKRGRKTRMDLLFANTACADLSVAFFLVLSDLFWHKTHHWYAGNAACKIVRYLAIVATYSSNYAIVALSLDRCHSVARPMQSYSRGLKGCRVYIGVSWGLSFLFSLSAIIMFRVNYEETQCGIIKMNSKEWQIYFTIAALSIFVFPAIIITICYTIIVAIVWKNSAFTVSDSATLVQNATILNSEARNTIGRETLSRAKIKSIKITFGIVVAFILSWSPYFIFNFLSVYHHIAIDSYHMRQMSVLFQTFAPINSAVNPLLFLIFNGKQYFEKCKKNNPACHTDVTH
ncbi:cardioacceleratory peptide receptor-like [Crassostrea virginica]|uniref:Cardioacceleratory peptide receptor-like isoform X1 n=2 Tax=Crassostrea virginica TaxID=6565 RepID=A0A8B8D911_CRAVI|nr:cardioacceleratory peptide receptor-like isoform X1 [Crassostrea virginica]